LDGTHVFCGPQNGMILLSDGSRKLQLELTEAQFDVFLAAMEFAHDEWKKHDYRKRSDVHTLQRARSRLLTAWSKAPRY